MPRFRKRTRKTIGRSGRQLGRTLLDDNVTLTMSQVVIIEPAEGVSGTGTVKVADADYAKIVDSQAIVKYVNVRFESGVRDVAPSAPGFVEYAFVIFDEQSGTPATPSAISSALGTNTLGQLCHTYFRGKCIWEGAFRVSRELSII